MTRRRFGTPSSHSPRNGLNCGRNHRHIMLIPLDGHGRFGINAMKSSKIKSALETTTNIAVVLVAITVYAFFVTNYYRQRQVAKAPVLEPGLEKGSTLPLVQGVNYKDSRKTLLIVMNTQCGYCADSVQFYNRVMESQIDAKSPVRILALFPNSEDAVKKFIDDRHLKVTSISGVDLVKF